MTEQPQASKISPRLEAESLRLAASPLAGTTLQIQVAAGDRVLLEGASGAGKSSLLRALIAFSPFQDGQLRADGEAMTAIGPASFRRKVCLVSALRSRPLATVAELFEQLGEFRGDLGTKAEFGTVLKSLDLPANATETQCESLSVGEWQRVLVALALLGHAKVILLDETFAHLDAATGAKVVEVLAQYQSQSQCGIVWCGHRAEELLARSNRIWQIEGGKLRERSA